MNRPHAPASIRPGRRPFDPIAVDPFTEVPNPIIWPPGGPTDGSSQGYMGYDPTLFTTNPAEPGGKLRIVIKQGETVYYVWRRFFYP